MADNLIASYKAKLSGKQTGIVTETLAGKEAEVVQSSKGEGQPPESVTVEIGDRVVHVGDLISPLHPTDKSDEDWLLDHAAPLAAKNGWPVFEKMLDRTLFRRPTQNLNAAFVGAGQRVRFAIWAIGNADYRVKGLHTDAQLDAYRVQELAEVKAWRETWEQYKRAATQKGSPWTHEAADLLRKRV